MSWIQSDFIKSESAYIPPSWSDGTDEEIVTALEKHYAGEIDLTEYWSVGDERIIHLSAMSAMSPLSDTHAAQDIPFVISEIGGKILSDGVTECAFQVDQKRVLAEQGYMSSSSSASGGWLYCDRRTWANSIYKNALPSTLVGIFKEFINQSGYGGMSFVTNTNDYFALRAEIEITGSTNNSIAGEGTQIEWYKTSSNRQKTIDGVNTRSYWLRSTYPNSSDYYCYCNGSGYVSYASPNQNMNLALFGVI